MSEEPSITYSTEQRHFRVYREVGTKRLEFVDAVWALDAPDAARRAVKKHHDWRSDGLEWTVVVVPVDAIVSVTVTFEPQAAVAS